MKCELKFAAWTGRAPHAVEIPDETLEQWRFRAALEIAVTARVDLANLAAEFGANLDGANLDGASLRPIKADLFLILTSARAEAPGLLAALRAGRIDGSVYEGECACLVGTIANIRHVPVESLERDAARPAERWFLGIRKGDTPATNPVAKITEGWIVEFLAANGIPEQVAS